MELLLLAGFEQKRCGEVHPVAKLFMQVLEG
jgi:hypothetical protein